MIDFKIHLSKDVILKPLVDNITIEPIAGPPKPVYPALIKSIIFQQLSVKAARTIYHRFLTLFPSGYPDPFILIALPATQLRKVGLSRPKSSYVKAVAEFFIQENYLQKDWTQEPTESILDTLTQIKGVGIWTVHMLLISALQHPDIFPVHDHSIRKGMQTLYDLPPMPKKVMDNHLVSIASRWIPFRSYACKYIWAWKDNVFI